ncbi:hypothetical protein [Paracoccus sp. TOH]|uniref:Uncharacterized protein n=1 Tax=Paracoccus simplex TaxID=2086346 RepID=A0ABV7S2I0_9RHOB|nr:hypothetical protein [Paracoccus sp. TOH]WJS84989.1 hypothetical protein NBE95_04195 [Paracoccus sp. TOH]
MRVLSILCGLSFAVMAGFFLACSTVVASAQPALRAIDLVMLGRIFGPLSWAALALALLGAGLALRSRCEGWAPLVAGCAIFVPCQFGLPHVAGLAGTALLCLTAAGLALSPLTRMPISYWRVAG